MTRIFAIVAAIVAATFPLVARPTASQPLPQAAPPTCSFHKTDKTLSFVGVSRFEVGATCGTISTTGHVIVIDLTQPGLSFQTSSRIGEAFQTELPTSFLTSTGGAVAFNANLFTGCCSYTASAPALLRGFEVADGQMLSPVGNNPSPAQDFPFDTSLVAIGSSLRILPSHDVAPGSVGTAVTGSHRLLRSGINVAPTTPSSGEFYGPNSRTVAGLSADNQTLWVVAIDGGTGGGLTLPQAADLLLFVGAANAINLDGGGSTTLAVRDADGTPRIINRPSDSVSGCTVPANGGCERYVGAIFVVHASALPTRGH